MFRNLVMVVLVAFFAAGCGALGGNKPQVIQEPDRKVTVKENCKRQPDGSTICRPVHAATPAEQECYGTHPTDPEARRLCVAAAQTKNNRSAVRRADPEGYQQAQRRSGSYGAQGGNPLQHAVPPFLLPYVQKPLGY